MLKRSARKREDKLVHIDDIKEDMRLIDGSDTDYITPSAKVYKDYGNGYFYPKKIYQNNANKYLYVNISFSDGVNRSRRLHVLLAKAYILNPDPSTLKYVGHKDNIKWHCSIDNLYWTNNKDNVVKAVEDGLLTNDKGECDSQSEFIKVIDAKTGDIVGVYGSIRQCDRCVENITTQDIAKLYKKKNYKPRSRKYIYQLSTREEFDANKNLQSATLVESPKVNKKPKMFVMSNESIGYQEVFDNQTQASKICGICQADISHLIKTGGERNGWQFKYLDEIDYSESSGYRNMLDYMDSVTVKNINTGEMINFDCKSHMLEHFGLTGHETSAYFDKKHVIMSEWIVV